MKIYISGKITDPDPEQQKKNLDKFGVVAKMLGGRGYEVFNPADLEVEGGASWEHYLSRDLKWIYENRPKLYVMNNWRDSRGARLEVEFATLLGLEIEYA